MRIQYYSCIMTHVYDFMLIVGYDSLESNSISGGESAAITAALLLYHAVTMLGYVSHGYINY